MSYLRKRRRRISAALAILATVLAAALIPLHHAWAALAGIPDELQLPLQGLQFGDFDGDGKADVFQVVGVQWRFSSAGVGQWQNLSTSSVTLDNLRFGDFDGDKKTDVFSIDGNQWRYSSGGASSWQNLTTSDVPLADLRFADFNGDLKTDVFNVDGAQWRYSSGGVTAWINLASSSVPFSELRLGDFDGDGIADVFHSNGSQWRFSSGGVASWQNLFTSSVPLTELRFGDFDGDKKTDVFSIDGTQWRFSSGGATAWQNLAMSDVPLANLRFGDFNGDKKTDVFAILDGRWAYSSAGATPWINLGPPTPVTPGTPVSPTASPGTSTPPPGSPMPPPGTPMPPPGNCTNQIVNGDFEMDGFWTFGRAPVPAVFVGGERHSGQRSVQMGIVPPGANQVSYSSIRQQVTIPANASTAELSWWRLFRSEEPPTETPGREGDRQEVILLSSSGQTLAVLQRVRRNDNAWRQDVVDLSAFRGQSVYVYFNTYNDGAGGRTWMNLDDVVLGTCSAGGGGPWPMPMPMPMPMPGGGATGMPPHGDGGPMPQPMPKPSSVGNPLPSASPGAPGPTATPKPEELPAGGEFVEAVVSSVGDGDTIEVIIDGKPVGVRYIGIRAPELSEPFGQEAAALNRKLVEGKLIYLERDVSDMDQFGRLLRYVYLDDGTFVNERMVRQGLAVTDLAPPDLAYSSLLLQAQQQAQLEGVGMWTPAIPSQPPGQAQVAPTTLITPTEVAGAEMAPTAVTATVVTPEPSPAAATPAATRTVRTEPAQANGCVNLVNNGEFEAPDAGWTMVGVESPPAYVADPTFGDSQFAMRLGIAGDMPNMAGTSAVAQDVNLPSNASEIVLSFRYLPVYDAPPGSSDLQYADIYLASTDRFIGRALGVQANRDQWLISQYDLTAFAGQRVRLFFGVNNDGANGRMAMFVDNVTVSACSPAATTAAASTGLVAGAGQTRGAQPAVTELAAQDANSSPSRVATVAVLAGVVAASVVLSAMIVNGRRLLG